MMKIVNGFFCCCLAACFFSGCAPTRTWVSTPAYQATENQVFAARLTPLSGRGTFINQFRLEVKNKTPQPLEIDWNQTRYLYNQAPSGRFVFAGITAENIKNPPAEVVPAAGRLEKIIAPVNLIAWRKGPGHSNQPAFSAGPLPEGENGILLVIRQNGAEIRARMNVTISVKKESSP